MTGFSQNNMGLNIEDIRIRLDQQTERIVSGLKDRSRYPLNLGVYSEHFCDGKTWFEYRLFMDQSVDAEFGRFEFDDQHPILFQRPQLPSPKVKRDWQNNGLIATDIDIGGRIIEFYKKVLPLICPDKREDRSSYGETVKADSNNILCLYERICGIGQYVAQSKINADSTLLRIQSKDGIRSKLVNREREEIVTARAIEIASRYELPNPEVLKDIFRAIIGITVDVEIDYVEKIAQKNTQESRTPPGFGQTASKFKPSGTGWGN